MALFLLDGFDHYTSNGGDAPTTLRYAGDTLVTDTGRFGGQSLKFTGQNISLGLPSGGFSTGSIGFAYEPTLDALNGFNRIPLQWISTATSSTQFSLFTETDGKVGICNQTDLGQIKLISAPGALTTGVWQYIEVVWTHDGTSDTGSSATIYVNGVSVATASGVNLRNGTSRTPDLIHFNFPNATFIDDMYVNDTATRLGEMKITTLVPNADTAQKDFTPSTGTTNFGVVDELPWSADTDYNSANTAGNYDLFDLTTLSATPISIIGVQVAMFARKDDVGDRTIRSKVKSSTTTVNGATQGLATGYTMLVDTPMANDPATSAAWTISAINALQAGYEIVA